MACPEENEYQLLFSFAHTPLTLLNICKEYQVVCSHRVPFLSGGIWSFNRNHVYKNKPSMKGLHKTPQTLLEFQAN